MKRLLAVALILVGSFPAWGDTLILKDGKTVEWVALRDLGDSYDVETKNGTKLTIQKSDVEKLVTVTTAPPLTGATFTFDKKLKLDTIDLLSKVDLKRDGFAGTWKFAAGGIVGAAPQGAVQGADHAKLEFPFTPASDEYDLTLTLERKEGTEDIGIGLIGGQNQFTFVFDAFKCSWSGIFLVDGKGPHEGGSGIQGKVFENGKPRMVTFMVRKEAFIVRLDGKDFWTWKPDWSRVTAHPAHAPKEKNHLYLATFQSTWAVSQVRFSFPKAKP